METVYWRSATVDADTVDVKKEGQEEVVGEEKEKEEVEEEVEVEEIEHTVSNVEKNGRQSASTLVAPTHVKWTGLTYNGIVKDDFNLEYSIHQVPNRMLRECKLVFPDLKDGTKGCIFIIFGDGGGRMAHPTHIHVLLSLFV